jgi:hypothetical protein
MGAEDTPLGEREKQWIGGGGGVNKVHEYSIEHKVQIYKEYHSVCPLVGTRTLASECAPPQEHSCLWALSLTPVANAKNLKS